MCTHWTRWPSLLCLRTYRPRKRCSWKRSCCQPPRYTCQRGSPCSRSTRRSKRSQNVGTSGRSDPNIRKARRPEPHSCLRRRSRHTCQLRSRCSPLWRCFLWWAFPATRAYVPVGHAMQLAPELTPRRSEYVPARQSRQLLSLELPSICEYLPSTQSRQAASSLLPCVSRYLPLAQSMQSDDALFAVVGANLPAAQLMQSSTDVLPVRCVYVPLGHLSQLKEDTTHVWKPAWQAPSEQDASVESSHLRHMATDSMFAIGLHGSHVSASSAEPARLTR